MKRQDLLLAAITAVVFWAIPVQAEERQLTASEIEVLLTGNTVSGTWSGTPYKQYYGEGGFTMYVPKGGPPDQGRWRVNHETNQYESWWHMTNWTPYTVVETDDGLAWVNGETLQHFEVLDGRQVSW
ncbi:hypothetical protein ROA7450_01282 [Roseovarius albus]|uniref:DUF995 domain-containing protein n=1 Tax=Roseovarius albus TaxID=1247867 RepID=A0A1X6YSU6_9RHOB|nr:hypothetical protein [Roseovarius albus]SLN29783.1 hypothetical protein ROA7450_01282 [Roseovarius albus]